MYYNVCYTCPRLSLPRALWDVLQRYEIWAKAGACAADIVILALCISNTAGRPIASSQNKSDLRRSGNPSQRKVLRDQACCSASKVVGGACLASLVTLELQTHRSISCLAEPGMQDAGRTDREMHRDHEGGLLWNLCWECCAEQQLSC